MSKYNNVSEQNYFDKPVFNSIRRLNHSSPMNNAVTNKTRHFFLRFALGPLKIDSKRNWHYFISQSTITAKLDIYVPSRHRT